MNLEQTIEEAFKAALKGQDKIRLSALRMLRSALKNKAVEKRRKLEESEILSVIKGLIRQGNEAFEQFEKGDRPDLAEKEKAEIAFYATFMPAQAGLEEVEGCIDRILTEVQASGMKDMGRVMKLATARLAGRAEGQTIQAVVKQKLSSL